LDRGKIVIAGCGFLGEATAGFFLEAGWRVLGLCATAESAGRLSGSPFAVAVSDISKPMAVPAGWSDPDVILHCASSGRGGADAYRAVYRDGLQHLLQAFSPKRLIFTGSTSVYSQADGSWVNEESPAEPDRETGQILLEAEKIALDSGGIVARLAGIYGPGRSVLLKKFLDGSALLEAGGHRWINQIHRDDGARALLALAQNEMASGVYNVSDDTPTSQREIYGWIAGFLNRALPPEGPADLNRKRGWTSKRISNQRLRSVGWMPVYPSYKAALPELIASA